MTYAWAQALYSLEAEFHCLTYSHEKENKLLLWLWDPYWKRNLSKQTSSSVPKQAQTQHYCEHPTYPVTCLFISNQFASICLRKVWKENHTTLKCCQNSWKIIYINKSSSVILIPTLALWFLGWSCFTVWTPSHTQGVKLAQLLRVSTLKIFLKTLL